MMTFPWVRILSGFYQAGDYLEVPSFKSVVAWIERCESRPATAKGLTVCSMS